MEKMIKHFWFALALSVMLNSGCSQPAPDPLAGFHVVSLANLDSNKVINDDCKDYLKNLPEKQKGRIGTTFFYENGAGQHAVSIQIFEGNQNASWQHVLIYDKNNKRIQAVRCDYVKYES